MKSITINGKRYRLEVSKWHGNVVLKGPGLRFGCGLPDGVTLESADLRERAEQALAEYHRRRLEASEMIQQRVREGKAGLGSAHSSFQEGGAATMSRQQRQPIRYETGPAFVDYADGRGEMREMTRPVYDVPPECEALRRLRLTKNLTLRAASEILGLKPSELSGVEHGRFEASPEERAAWTAALQAVDTRPGPE